MGGGIGGPDQVLVSERDVEQGAATGGEEPPINEGFVVKWVFESKKR